MTLHTQGTLWECSHEARLDQLLGEDVETLLRGLKKRAPEAGAVGSDQRVSMAAELT